MAEVVIVGGGVAGLACARHLHAQGVEVLVLESSDAVGGRVRTDELSGFRLDRGFQVLLTAYPEVRQLMDPEALALRPFDAGVLIRAKGHFHAVHGPWKRPLAWLDASLSDLGTMGDKLRALRLRSRVVSGPLDVLWRRTEVTSLEALEVDGFSSTAIDVFFRPLVGALFLERELVTSSRHLEFLLRMLALGEAALPAAGIEAIPRQLAAGLPEGSVRTGAPVLSIQSDGVSLRTGEWIEARRVVVATDAAEAERLVELRGADTLALRAPHHWRGVTCLYFAANEPPVPEKLLVLNGEGRGPVNHLCVPTAVAPEYGPPGSALVSASVLAVPRTPDEEADLLEAVLGQMREWFGEAAREWTHLRTYVLPQSLPDQSPGRLEPGARSPWVGTGLAVCGDHRESGSLQGALASGRRAAEALLEEAVVSSRA
jgi:phytoene dehydrogenase-like protein